MKKSYLKARKKRRKGTIPPAKKALGQNFLTDEHLLDELAELTQASSDDCVLEIGAGPGGLSLPIAKRAGKLICVELDGDLLPYLKIKLEGHENVSIIQGDALTLDLDEILSPYQNIRIVGNLPYHLTTPLMEKFFSLQTPVKSVSVMVQKEAGERICADRGTSLFGPLGALVRLHGEPEVAKEVPARLFSPPPKVDSVFLHIPFYENLMAYEDRRKLMRFIRQCFLQKRKTLYNNLQSYKSLPRETWMDIFHNLDLLPTVRAEEVDVDTFRRLYTLIEEKQ
ncbi:MAG: 16S rRNA (adenine(1518)-N(6)/adenine(1519)-N(6))-dimethyltransferase RsmA [Christensenellales bacterium]